MIFYKGTSLKKIFVQLCMEIGEKEINNIGEHMQAQSIYVRSKIIFRASRQMLLLVLLHFFIFLFHHLDCFFCKL